MHAFTSDVLVWLKTTPRKVFWKSGHKYLDPKRITCVQRHGLFFISTAKVLRMGWKRGSRERDRILFRAVFWDILPCKIIVDRRFRGAYCLHHQGIISQKTALNIILAAVRTWNLTDRILLGTPTVATRRLEWIMRVSWVLEAESSGYRLSPEGLISGHKWVSPAHLSRKLTEGGWDAGGYIY
jgi:hypothetical protein